MSAFPESVFIAGCGDVGLRVAKRWIARGVPVTALCRSAEKRAALLDQGVRCVDGDLDDPDFRLPETAGADGIYYFVPPQASGVSDRRVRSFLGQLAVSPGKFVLISTTGVYGDCRGQWVSEGRPTRPQTDRARRRVDAENAVTVWCRDRHVSCTILRVAGIYGPGRLPLKRIREGSPMLSLADCGYTNRIHIEDLVEVCLRSMVCHEATGIINVSDGSPGNMRDYFDRVAAHFSLPKPPTISGALATDRLSPGMLEYLRESRRIDNRHLLDVLGITLRFPDLESGLAAINPDTPEP